VKECEFALNSILDDLQRDSWPLKQGCRAERCSGTALNIAISLLEAAGGAGRGSRIVNLLGGPVTYGPGKIVDELLSEKIRSHLDIQKERENTRHLKPAVKFYSECAARAQKQGIVLDVFVAALDHIMTDSFGNPVFKESFKKFFELDANQDLKMGFLATTKLLCSKEFKINGVIG
jgi:protein transport protein SEC23